METDLQQQDTPEYRQMQDMIANNQRELDAKTQRLSKERLDFLRGQGGENWAGGGAVAPVLTREEQSRASALAAESSAPRSLNAAISQGSSGSFEKNVTNAVNPLRGK